MPRPKERFCRRGHDTDEAGRDIHGYCKECRRENDRHRERITDPSTGKRIRVKGYNHPIEWERARVERWAEIVRADPLDKRQGTNARGREFAIRYERLEASLPTPVDA